MRHSTISAKILLVIVILCGCGGGGGDGSSTLNITFVNAHAPIDAELVHGSIFKTSVTINDSIHLDMLVDTGAENTHVPSGIFGNPNGQVLLSSLCFGNGTCFNNFTAYSSDSAFTQTKEGYFNGIIGIDLLRHFDITFDHKTKSIYFYDVLQNDSSNHITIPIHYENNRPFANISINNLPQGMNLIDTGAAFTRVTSSMLGPFTLPPEIIFNTIVFNFNGSEVVSYINLDNYCVGMACPDSIVAQIGSWPAIGGTFFREYLTVFKFSENIVKLDRYPDRDHVIESGIQRIGLQLDVCDASQVVYVIAGSYAWESGIREDYDIISVNGIPIDSLGYFGIYDLLSDTAIHEFQFVVINQSGNIEDFIISVG